MSSEDLIVPEERIVVANGLRHHVIEWAPPGPSACAAKTIVCCHGFLDVGFSYHFVAQHLARAGFRVVAFDWRGHGQSAWVGAGGYYHFVDYLFDLSDLVKQIAPDGFHLVGHSMGGTAAGMFAGLRPEGLDRLVLIEGLGPPEMPTEHLPDRIAEWMHGVRKVRASTPRAMADLDEAIKRLHSQHGPLPEAVGRFIAEKSTRRSDAGLHFAFDPLHKTRSPMPFRLDQFRALLSRVTAKTLFVSGQTGFKTLDHAERLSAIAGAREVEIAGVGHMIHWLSPEPLATAIRDHLG
jgi:pimeloyl-ACP methyl ester carboxylesterase